MSYRVYIRRRFIFYFLISFEHGFIFKCRGFEAASTDRLISSHIFIINGMKISFDDSHGKGHACHSRFCGWCFPLEVGHSHICLQCLLFWHRVCRGQDDVRHQSLWDTGFGFNFISSPTATGISTTDSFKSRLAERFASPLLLLRRPGASLSPSESSDHGRLLQRQLSPAAGYDLILTRWKDIYFPRWQSPPYFLFFSAFIGLLLIIYLRFILRWYRLYRLSSGLSAFSGVYLFSGWFPDAHRLSFWKDAFTEFHCHSLTIL